MKQTKQEWLSGEISLIQLTPRLSWISKEDKRIMNGNQRRNEAAVENGNLLRLGHGDGRHRRRAGGCRRSLGERGAERRAKDDQR